MKSISVSARTLERKGLVNFPFKATHLSRPDGDTLLLSIFQVQTDYLIKMTLENVQVAALVFYY